MSHAARSSPSSRLGRGCLRWVCVGYWPAKSILRFLCIVKFWRQPRKMTQSYAASCFLPSAQEAATANLSWESHLRRAQRSRDRCCQQPRPTLPIPSGNAPLRSACRLVKTLLDVAGLRDAVNRVPERSVAAVDPVHHTVLVVELAVCPVGHVLRPAEVAALALIRTPGIPR